MGEHIDGLHHRVAHGAGQGLHLPLVDRLTKYAHFFAISARYTTSQVANLFFRDIFRLHGLPKTIVSDRDNRFMGGFWQQLLHLVGTKLTPSTNYHPQTDGQTEIVNK